MRNLTTNNFSAIVATVGLSVGDIIDRPPIDMIKKGLGAGLTIKLEEFMASQLDALRKTVNIPDNLNLQPYQIPAIAKELIKLYPIESLEDFVLCFRRGALGFYGKVFNIDAAVLCNWMAIHLEEKYQQIEANTTRAQIKHNEANEVNYEEFKKRSTEVFAREKRESNEGENDYQRRKLENPYKYFNIRGLQVYATSEAHAEEIIKRLIALGEVEEVK